jgi:hypothetical protein
MLTLEYMENAGFVREQDSEKEWHDRDNIRMVLHNEANGELRWEMFVFDDRSHLLYSVDFSLDTPHAVVIATIDAAIKNQAEVVNG